MVCMLWAEEEPVSHPRPRQSDMRGCILQGQISFEVLFCHWTDVLQLLGARGVPPRYKGGCRAWHRSV